MLVLLNFNCFFGEIMLHLKFSHLWWDRWQKSLTAVHLRHLLKMCLFLYKNVIKIWGIKFSNSPTIPVGEIFQTKRKILERTLANLNIDFPPDFTNFVAKSTQSGEFFVSELFVDNLPHIFNQPNIVKFRGLTL